MSLTKPPVSGVRSGTSQPRGVTLGDPGEITAMQPAAMEGELSGPWWLQILKDISGWFVVRFSAVFMQFQSLLRQVSSQTAFFGLGAELSLTAHTTGVTLARPTCWAPAWTRVQLGQTGGGHPSQVGMVWFGVVWCGRVQYGTVWYGMEMYGTARYRTMWHGTVWYFALCYTHCIIVWIGLYVLYCILHCMVRY